MARLIPDARLHLYRGGHIALITEARDLAPVIEDFLDELTRQACDHHSAAPSGTSTPRPVGTGTARTPAAPSDLQDGTVDHDGRPRRRRRAGRPAVHPIRH